jgi:hypothetical protein
MVVSTSYICSSQMTLMVFLCHVQHRPFHDLCNALCLCNVWYEGLVNTHTHTHISLVLLIMVIMCNVLLLVSMDLFGTATVRLCQKLPAVGICMADKALKLQASS